MKKKRNKTWRPFYTGFLLLWAFLVLVSFIVLELYVSLSSPILFLIATTIATFLLFGIDKWQAIRRSRRVPELVLYLVTFLGGSVGSLLGMNVFRHKTSKTSFQFWVVLIILAHLGIIYALRNVWN